MSLHESGIKPTTDQFSERRFYEFSSEISQ